MARRHHEAALSERSHTDRLHLQLRDYLHHIRDHPVSFTQHSPEALTILGRRAADPLTPEQFNACLNLAGAQGSQGWAGVRAGDFDFPREHGPHYDIRDEWYYLAANFFDDSGAGPISIVFSSRRRGIVPPFMQHGGEPGDFDLWLQQVAVTIPADELHTNSLTYQLSADTPTDHGFAPFRWMVGGQGIRSLGPEMFPMEFAAEDDDVEIRLEMTMATAGSGIFPQGRLGCAPCIDGLGYRYYSWPIIEASGTLRHKSTGRSYPLKGKMWMDHQWSSRIGPFGYLDCVFLRAWMAVKNQVEPHFTRWNWFYFHLLKEGRVTDAVTTVKIPADGVESGTGPFPLTHTTTVDDRWNYRSRLGGGTITSTELLDSPISGSPYPLGWTLALDDMQVKLMPTMRDQFIGTEHDHGAWEGGVTVEGTKDGDPVHGFGFAEIMGYEEEDHVIECSLELLGLDTSLVPIFRPVEFTLRRRVQAALLLALPLVALAGTIALLWAFFARLTGDL